MNTPGGHIRRRPSAPAFGLTGISLPCFLTGSDFRLIAVQLPVPLSPDGGRLSAMVSLTGSLIARLSAAQSAVVSADVFTMSKNSAVALAGLIWSAGWSCTNAFRAVHGALLSELRQNDGVLHSLDEFLRKL